MTWILLTTDLMHYLVCLCMNIDPDVPCMNMDTAENHA